MRTIVTSTFALLTIVCNSNSTEAQNVIPGGWSNEIRYQSVGAGYTFGQSFGQFGWDSGRFGTGVVTTPNRRIPASAYRQQTINNLGFMGETVRRSVKPRRTR